MQIADYSIGPTLLNKKSFNDFFLTSAKHRRTIEKCAGPSILKWRLT